MSQHISHDELVSTAQLRTESGENWILHYFLQVFEGENGGMFGLRIDKTATDNTLFEREETGAITESRDEALIMAKAFAKGSVPPVTLLEMADDWASEATLLPA
jgi:hypothetical protein